MKTYFKIIILLIVTLFSLMANAQYYTVYKTDGSSVVYSHAEVDSIVFSNETAPLIINGHEAVDLGLSVKWATCNVGAEKPEECGGYYAWGEVTTKERYDWTTYKYSTNNNSRDAYYSIGSNIAGTKYDAATSEWGSGWRMPDEEELNELWEKCEWEYTSLNGNDGVVVTGPNGNSIFLPSNGFKWYPYNTDHEYVDWKNGITYYHNVYLWSANYSSKSSSCATYLGWSKSQPSINPIKNTSDRGVGYGIRPVTK